MFLLKNLTAPYPPIGNQKERFWLPFYAGGFVAFFLFVFRPFSIGNLEGLPLLLEALAYGGITVICIAINVWAIPYLFPFLFVEKRWTVLAEIFFNVFNLLLITFGNSLFNSFECNKVFTITEFLDFVKPTFTIGFFPISFFVLWRQINLEKKNAAISKSIEPILESHIAAEQAKPIHSSTSNGTYIANNSVTLYSEDARDELTLNIDQIFYFESAANYVELVYLNDKGTIKKVLFRNTMKNMEQQISAHPHLFFRCHRSFIVNLNKIAKVRGTGQGISLWIGDGMDWIPVSRGNVVQLKELLAEDTLVGK